LRHPLEDGVATTSRAQGTVSFPAKMMLVGAMNPCPCGYHGDSLRPCACSQTAVTEYPSRISGALLDRIDIYLDVPQVDYDKPAEVRDFCRTDDAARLAEAMQYRPSSQSRSHSDRKRRIPRRMRTS
jgi:predicted ATPase with chaperone activity